MERRCLQPDFAETTDCQNQLQTDTGFVIGNNVFLGQAPVGRLQATNPINNYRTSRLQITHGALDQRSNIDPPGQNVLMIFAGRLSYNRRHTALWLGPCFQSRQMYAECAWRSSSGGVKSMPGVKRTIVTTACGHMRDSLAFMGDRMPSKEDFITSSASNQWARVVGVLDAVNYDLYDAIVVSRLDVIWKGHLHIDATEQAIRYAFDEPNESVASDVFYYVPRPHAGFFHEMVREFANSTDRQAAQKTFLAQCRLASVPCRPLVEGMYPSATSQFHEKANPLFYMRGSRPWGVGTLIFLNVCFVVAVVVLVGSLIGLRNQIEGM